MEKGADAAFAALLRRLREARSITQEELAERAGLTAKGIGALERGERRRPYPSTVRALADALWLDPAERSALIGSIPSRAGPGSGQADPDVQTDEAGHISVALVGAAPLLGREAEVASVAALVRAGGPRVVTLTGPGGVGKTRLAEAVASRVRAEFPGGCVVVDLAPVRDPAMVLPRLAGALGAPDTGTGASVGALAPYLGGRRVLVVLDNLEQVLGCAPTVAELVVRCPDLIVLATSRAPLRIRPEREVRVAPLPIPADDSLASVAASPSVAMFLDRAEASGAPMALGKENAATLAAICRRLDGLPLVIELAAASARLLTPAALLERLDQLGRDTAPRDLPNRQRTMAATIDWSQDLLAPEQRATFVELAVFVGGFSLDSVEQVVGDEADARLAPLLEQSLVLRVPEPDEVPRFRLLEPVRQYAVERLLASGRALDTADRHAAAFHRLAVGSRQLLHGPDLVVGLDRLEADHANLRSAFLRLVETGRVGMAVDLLGHVWLYFSLRGHAREALDWLERVDPADLDDPGQTRADLAAAGLLFVTGDIAQMRRRADAALTRARTLGHDGLAAESAVLAASAAVFAADLKAAAPLVEEAASYAVRAGDRWAAAHARYAGAQLAVMTDAAGAGARVEQAEATARELGNPFTVAAALNLRANVTETTGDHVRSAELLAEATRISVEAQLGWSLGYAVPALAGLAVSLGEAETAARLFGAAASLSSASAVDPRFPTARALSDRDFAAVRAALGDERFRAAWDAGRATTPSEVAGLAEELRRLVRG